MENKFLHNSLAEFSSTLLVVTFVLFWNFINVITICVTEWIIRNLTNRKEFQDAVIDLIAYSMLDLSVERL